MSPLNRPVPSIAQTSFDHDLEARIPTARHMVEGHHKPGLSSCIVLPPRAIHRTSRSSLAIEDSIDAIDAFFGVARPHGSRTNRSYHKSYVAGQQDAPPSYADATNPPPYASAAEPPTLAMYLFKFGFFFPLFWIAGSFVLVSQLKPPENWEPSKSEAERQKLLQVLRSTEVKWGKRCLLALLLLLLLAAIIVLAVALALRF